MGVPFLFLCRFCKVKVLCDEDEKLVQDIDNEDSFKICALINVSLFEITYLGTRPNDKNPNSPRRSN